MLSNRILCEYGFEEWMSSGIGSTGIDIAELATEWCHLLLEGGTHHRTASCVGSRSPEFGDNRDRAVRLKIGTQTPRPMNGYQIFKLIHFGHAGSLSSARSVSAARLTSGIEGQAIRVQSRTFLTRR